jgi:hypothetical protein
LPGGDGALQVLGGGVHFLSAAMTRTESTSRECKPHPCAADGICCLREAHVGLAMIGTPPDLVLTPPPLRLDEPFREPAEHAAHDHADKRADYRKPRVVRPDQNVRTLRRAGVGRRW